MLALRRRKKVSVFRSPPFPVEKNRKEKHLYKKIPRKDARKIFQTMMNTPPRSEFFTLMPIGGA